jgi:hypothetical protein
MIARHGELHDPKLKPKIRGDTAPGTAGYFLFLI